MRLFLFFVEFSSFCCHDLHSALILKQGGRLEFALWTPHLRVGAVSCDCGQPRVGDLGVAKVDGGDVGAVSRDCGQPRIGDLGASEVNGGDVGAVSCDCGQPRIGDPSVAFDFGRVLVPRHTPRHANEGRGVAVKEAQNVVTQRLNSECASDLET